MSLINLKSNTPNICLWKICFGFVIMVKMVSATSYVKLSVPKLIRSDGYDVEVHHVTTEDGYILELHRIPYGRNETFSNERRPVAFFGHCIFCSSSSFVVLGPSKAVAYKLANNGYDVWILNARGTTDSQDHVYLSPKSRKFWQFSWHEMGIYDVPASIDYVLKVTGERQVNYVGFSMGSTQFFVLMSERPEYNAKIRKMVAMAPVAYFNSSTGHFPFKQPWSGVITKFGADTGRLIFPPQEIGINEQVVAFCRLPNIKNYARYCNGVLGIFGVSNVNINPKLLPFFLLYFPDSTSIRSTTHYSQLNRSGRFAKYSYGQKLNLQIYGSVRPPSYDISKITAPVNFIWSKGDTVADHRDVARFGVQLPNLQVNHEVKDPNFDHLHFIWHNNADTLVYDIILDILR